MQSVQLRRTKRLLAGHPWVFSNELAHSVKGVEPGALVELCARDGRFLGIGYLNPHSLIAVRLLSRQRQAIDGAFLQRRLRAAIDHRQRLMPGRDGERLVFSEGDGLPGLIVDRYADCLVLQISTAGMERLCPLVIDALVELVKPKTIVLRNDSQARTLEGLPQERILVHGALDALPQIHEGPVRFEVDPMAGQKTGFFLDQHDNRLAWANLIRGGRGLDLFCYTGAWGMQAAANGAEVTAVDQSATALKQTAHNRDLNGLDARVQLVESDVFAFLVAQDGAGVRYDFVAVDPPAFVKSKRKLKEALRAYRELNAAVLRLVSSGGLVASSTCSYHVDRQSFVELLRGAAQDSGKNLRLLALAGQARDHPIPLAMPEAEYLKCAFLQVL